MNNKRWVKQRSYLRANWMCKNAESCGFLTLSWCQRGPRRLCVCWETHLWWGWGRSCCVEPFSTAPGRPGLYSGWCGTTGSQLERAQWVQLFFSDTSKDFCSSQQRNLNKTRHHRKVSFVVIQPLAGCLMHKLPQNLPRNPHLMFIDVNAQDSLVIHRSITSIDRYSQAICVKQQAKYHQLSTRLHVNLVTSENSLRQSTEE